MQEFDSIESATTFIKEHLTWINPSERLNVRDTLYIEPYKYQMGVYVEAAFKLTAAETVRFEKLDEKFKTAASAAGVGGPIFGDLVKIVSGHVRGLFGDFGGLPGGIYALYKIVFREPKRYTQFAKAIEASNPELAPFVRFVSALSEYQTIQGFRLQEHKVLTHLKYDPPEITEAINAKRAVFRFTLHPVDSAITAS